MVDLNRINPVTDFVRNYKAYLDRIKASGRPEVFTVNGKPEFGVLDAATFEQMEAANEEARFIAAVQEGIEAMKRGEGQPAHMVLERIRSSRGR